MKSLLLFVLSVLSVVRSVDVPGLLYFRQDNTDYIATSVTQAPERAVIFEPTAIPATRLKAEDSAGYLPTFWREHPNGNSIIISAQIDPSSDPIEMELGDHQGYLKAVTPVDGVRGWIGVVLGKFPVGLKHFIMYYGATVKGKSELVTAGISYKLLYPSADDSATLGFMPFGPVQAIERTPVLNRKTPVMHRKTTPKSQNVAVPKMMPEAMSTRRLRSNRAPAGGK